MAFVRYRKAQSSGALSADDVLTLNFHRLCAYTRYAVSDESLHPSYHRDAYAMPITIPCSNCFAFFGCGFLASRGSLSWTFISSLSNTESYCMDHREDSASYYCTTNFSCILLFHSWESGGRASMRMALSPFQRINKFHEFPKE